MKMSQKLVATAYNFQCMEHVSIQLGDNIGKTSDF